MTTDKVERLRILAKRVRELEPKSYIFVSYTSIADELDEIALDIEREEYRSRD
jgi:hypothetical protein